MSETTGTNSKMGLEPAIIEALNNGSEKERLLALLDCVKGYRNEYNKENERFQYFAYFKCKDDYKKQIQRIKEIVRANFKE